ncbi:MAG: HAMP domain-containing histidine kinase [Ruminococcus sp.]|nr:HAMP domain-containing histidine kinase [Ruminococcus sp.]
MWIISLVPALLCIVFIAAYIRLRQNIHVLNMQLEEIEKGSHMELTVNGRDRVILTLCRILNRVLIQKDKSYLQYEKSEKQLKQNITGLAHDIRTPLTGASGYVQLARECGAIEADCDIDNKREHYLQAAESRLADLEDMLEELFLYTKLTGEDFTLSIGKLQVLPILSNCLLGLYTRFEEKGVSPEIRFEEETFSVPADEEALQRVFLNLIQNALLHGNGDILIVQKGNSLVFENTLPADALPAPERMFELFYKGESARRKGSSGLGLFIVKELMTRMKGDVKAELDEEPASEVRRLRIILSFSV